MINFCYTDGNNLVVQHCKLKHQLVEVRCGGVCIYYDRLETDDGTIISATQWDYNAVKEYTICGRTVTGIISDTMSQYSMCRELMRYLENVSDKKGSI